MDAGTATAVAESMTALVADAGTTAVTAAAEVVATAAPVADPGMLASELLTWLLAILSAVATALIPVLVRWIHVRTGLDKAGGTKKLIDHAVRSAVLATEEEARRLSGNMEVPSLEGKDKHEYAKKIATKLIEQYGLADWAEDRLDALLDAHVNAVRNGVESEEKETD
jgi:hypothetical protein